MVTDAGLPIICPHGLRGTWATIAQNAGVASHLVAKELGHESYKTTQKHYLSPETKDQWITKKATKELLKEPSSNFGEIVFNKVEGCFPGKFLN